MWRNSRRGRALQRATANRPKLKAMKLLRHLIPIIGIVAAFAVNAGEQLTNEAKGAAATPTAKELQRLQGRWEGVVAGDKSHDKITITIAGNSFHFHRDTNFWFETTITLPAATNPQQLRATIQDCPQSQ